MRGVLRPTRNLLFALLFAAPVFAQQFEPIRINSGGGDYVDAAGNLWSADRDFGPSVPASSGDPISGTADPFLLQTLRYSQTASLSYGFAVPNGTYRVRALFAEIWSGAFANGVRVFDIVAEEQTFFGEVDVFGEAGPNAALEKIFIVTVTDGTLNLDFVQKAQSPIVNAIEVTATSGPSTPVGIVVADQQQTEVSLLWNPAIDDTGVAGYEVERCTGAGCSDFAVAGFTSEAAFIDTELQPVTRYRYRVRAKDLEGNFSTFSAIAEAFTNATTTENFVLRVDAGGDGLVDSMGNSWSPDTGSIVGSTAVVSQSIAGTDDSLLYRSLRWNASYASELEYAFEVPNGEYVVKLHFAEIYLGAAYVGGRVFDVEIEGGKVLSDLDVFAEVGANAALVKTIVTEVRDSQINIRFLHGAREHPFVSAIEVISSGAEPPDEEPPADSTPPGVIDGISATAVSASKVDLYWTAASDDVGVVAYSVERCEGAGCSDYVQIASSDGLAYSDVAVTAATTYGYRVRARDAAGNVGGYSQAVEATTYDVPPPPVEEPPPPVEEPPPPVEEPPPPVEEPPPPVEEPPPPVEEPPPPVEEPPPPVEEPPPPVEEPPPPVEEPPPPVEEPPPPVEEPPPPVEEPPPPVEEPPPPVEEPPPPPVEEPPPPEDPPPGDEPAPNPGGPIYVKP
jgi:hypothetical protein